MPVYANELGIRKRSKERFCPHSLAYPALVSALRAFMGLPQHYSRLTVGSIQYKNDLDYVYQIAISGEGFGLMYDAACEAIQNHASERIKKCMEAAGIACYLAKTITPAELKTQIDSGLPLVVFRENGHHAIIIGYDEQTPLGIVFRSGMPNTGVELHRKAKPIKAWQEGMIAVAFVCGTTEPTPQREAVITALENGVKLLKTENCVQGEGYGYGKAAHALWQKRISDDSNYRLKKDYLRYITPEKFDLAERRWNLIAFFDLAEQYLGEGTLNAAMAASLSTHNSMWQIHHMVTGKNMGKLMDKTMREKIHTILCEAEKNDLIIAGCIAEALKRK